MRKSRFAVSLIVEVEHGDRTANQLFADVQYAVEKMLADALSRTGKYYTAGVTITEARNVRAEAV